MAIAPNDPERTDTIQYTYVFKGWNKEITAVTKDDTYIAEYNESLRLYTYYIYDYDRTTLLKSETVYYGTVIELPSKYKESTAQYTYNFVRWEFDDGKEYYQSDEEYDSMTVQSSFYLYRIIEVNINNYTVNWKNYDDSILLTESYAYGTIPTYKGKTPFREREIDYYYEFIGWDKDITEVVENVTFVAKFEKKNAELDYKLNSKKTGYIVTGIGRVINTNVVIPNVYNNLPVLEIGNQAFKNSKAISFIISENVTNIGDEAFYGCESLMSITIPDSVTGIGKSAFKNCILLKSVLIGNSVISIGDFAFDDCEALKTIKLPITVKNIGRYAFRNCFMLESITLPFVGGSTTANTYIGYIFGASSYSNNSEFVPATLKEVIILDGCITIEDDAFYGCKSLTTITIPESLTSIGNSAFLGCSSLKTIVIPNNVINLGAVAFEYCSSLTSVILGKNITNIGGSTFHDCTSLKNIYYNGTIEKWCGIELSNMYSNPMYYASNFNILDENGDIEYSGNNYSLLTKLVVPDSVSSIGNYQFYGFNNITTITLPFVGGSATANTYIGYIFGASSYSNNSEFVPSTLKEVIILDGCIGIEDYAFYDCTSLTSITIPKTVINIGNEAFYRCTSLTSVVIPNGVTNIGNDAFYRCTALTNVIIGESVTNIGEFAFSKCSSLISIVLGNNLLSIGDSAFLYCVRLVEVVNKSVLNIDKGSEDYGYVAYYAKQIISDEIDSKGFETTSDGFVIYDKDILINYIGSEKSIVIPNNIRTINNFAFYDCASLTNVFIGNSITSIGDEAFSGFTSLTNIIIPKNVTNIGVNAFYNCTSLTYVEFEDGVINIDRGAFSNCTSLTSITIPKSVTSIGVGAFENCTSLIKVVIGKNVTNINDFSFYKCYKLVEVINKSSLNITKGQSNYGHVAYYAKQVIKDESGTKISIDSNGVIVYDDGINIWLVGYLGSNTDLIIPNYVTDIYNYAVCGCKKLESITIPESVTNVGEYAFNNCTSLTNVMIMNGVTSIEQNAFEYCEKLENVSIPDSVVNIGKYAFKGCNGLKNIILGNGVTTIDNSAFSVWSLKKIYYKGTSPYSDTITIIQSGNEQFKKAKWYYFTSNGVDEIAQGNWWYYDTDGVTIIEKVIL